MEFINTTKYIAQHAGWLMACDNIENNAKGHKIYERLNYEWRGVADQTQADCLASHKKWAGLIRKP